MREEEKGLTTRSTEVNQEAQWSRSVAQSLFAAGARERERQRETERLLSRP